MFSLILATIGQTLFGLVVRHAQRNGRNLLAVGAINYLTCFVVFAIAVLVTGSSPPSRTTVITGLLGGVAYVIAYFLFVGAMALRGVSVPVAFTRLSVLVPIFFSVLLWGEHPNDYQAVGIVLALASLTLLSIRPGQSGSRLAGLPLLSALFFVNGGCMLSVKAFQEMGPPEQGNWFFLFVFAVASLISTGVWLRYRSRSSRQELSLGLALGASNVMGNVFLLSALAVLPGIIVFPITSALGIFLTTLFASLAWREKVHRPALVGIGLAIAAVVLVNMK